MPIQKWREQDKEKESEIPISYTNIQTASC